MKLSQIWCYPVKSCAGIRLDAAEVDARGIRFDRHWMLVDTAGRFLTQRQHPRMALIHPSLDGERLRLFAPGMPDLDLPVQETAAGTIQVQLWQDRCDAADAGGGAADWFSGFLGTAARLVYLPSESRRPVNPGFAGPDDQVGFADGFPFLLITDTAVDDLANRLGQSLDTRRFRPNLVVSGAQAHAEDGWRQVRVGEMTFRVVKPCSRCIITTVNPDTAERDRDTLGALRAYRQDGSRVYFGQNLVHDAPGRLHLGDEVRVIA